MSNEQEKILKKLIQDGKDAEVKLLALDKLVLEHGDYGYYKNGGLWWAWQRKGVLEVFGEYEGSGRKAQGAYSDMVKDGNHVSDLKGMGEELEEFKVPITSSSITGFCAGIDNNNVFYIGNIGDTWAFDIEKLDEIIQKLQRLRATARKKQNA